MKKLIILPLILITVFCSAQSINTNELVRVSNYQSPVPAKFRLYPTINISIFLRLNTATGFIDLVQYSTRDVSSSIVKLSEFPLVLDGPVDRFTLYPTTNIWTFLLLDQVEGTTYQVQWSTEPEKRFVNRIYDRKE
jgi:hypothetical protein